MLPRYKYGIAVTLLVMTAAIYLQTLGFNFIALDDDTYIVNNPFIRHGLTFSGITWGFGSVYAGNWHPLTWLSHMLDVQLFGLQPGGHHLTNVLFHLANTLLLFRVLAKSTGCLWRSAFVAALFGVQP